MYVPARYLYHSDYFRIRKLLGADKEVIAGEIERNLRQVLKLAVGFVPFYKRAVRLSAAELSHEPAMQLLQRFPYINKAQVMDCQRDFLDERLDPRSLHYVTSEGSSGEGIGVWRTKRLADIEKAFYAHVWGRLGFSFERARYLRMGADAANAAHEAPVNIIGNRILLSPRHVTESNKAAILSALNEFRPQFVHAYPSAAAGLSELISAGELNFQLEGVLLASEPATPRQLVSVERLFRCPISISYGLTERTNLAFADCRRAQIGEYRFEPLYGITENRWDKGHAEIVGTSCWNDVMPLIRYRTDDFGVIDGSGTCAAIDGRGNEFLVDRSGNPVPGLLITIDAATWEDVRLCQVCQSKPGAITLLVVARRGVLQQERKKIF
jgi:phenylacetate-CoA ligase